MALVYSSRVENKKKKKKSLLLLRFYNKCLKIEKHDLTIYFFFSLFIYRTRGERMWPREAEWNDVIPFFSSAGCLLIRKNANCCLIVDKTNGFVYFRWQGVCKCKYFGPWWKKRKAQWGLCHLGHTGVLRVGVPKPMVFVGLKHSACR